MVGESTKVESASLKLVDVFWSEAVGDIDNLLSKPLQAFKLADVSKAEGVLMQLKEELVKENTDRVDELSDEYFSIITYKKRQARISSVSDISRQRDLCQVGIDLIVCQIDIFHNIAFGLTLV